MAANNLHSIFPEFVHFELKINFCSLIHQTCIYLKMLYKTHPGITNVTNSVEMWQFKTYMLKWKTSVGYKFHEAPFWNRKCSIYCTLVFLGSLPSKCPVSHICILQAHPVLFYNHICIGPIQPLTHQGVGVTKPISSIPLFYQFFPSSMFVLPAKYHIHIWQVLLQLSCGDSHQIWMWFKESHIYFCVRSQISLTEKLTNGALVTPTIGLKQNGCHYV